MICHWTHFTAKRMHQFWRNGAAIFLSTKQHQSYWNIFICIKSQLVIDVLPELLIPFIVLPFYTRNVYIIDTRPFHSWRVSVSTRHYTHTHTHTHTYIELYNHRQWYMADMGSIQFRNWNWLFKTKNWIGIENLLIGISYKTFNPQINLPLNVLIQKYFFHDNPT